MDVTMKKLAVLTLAVLIGLSGGAEADENTDRMVELEQQIKEMSRALKNLQEEVAVLKQRQASKSGETAPSSTETHWNDRVTLNGEVRFRGYDLSNIWSFDDKRICPF